MAEVRPAPNGWRRRLVSLTPYVRGAVLGVLAWVPALDLGLPLLVGLGGVRGLALAAGAGALIGRWRPRLVRAVAAGVAGLYVVVAATPLVSVLMPTVVRSDVVSPEPPVDAVAVLSADVGTDGLVARQGIDRLLAGAALARAGDRPLVLSVVRRWGVRGAPSSEADQRALAAQLGVRRLYFVDSVRVTRDEAVREAALARREGWRRLRVVTSPAHSRRACAAYERAGVAVVCAPSPSREYALGGPHPLSGPRERVAAFRDWLYETVGWAVYRARGWV